MANLIEQRVEMALNGQNPFVICKMQSGWLVIGDVQRLPGYWVSTDAYRINYETLGNANEASA